MTRFLKVLVLLVVALFALVSGVDVTLDHMSHAGSQNAFTYYNQKGQAVAVYHGDLTSCPVYAKPQLPVQSGVLHSVSFASPAVD